MLDDSGKENVGAETVVMISTVLLQGVIATVQMLAQTRIVYTVLPAVSCPELRRNASSRETRKATSIMVVSVSGTGSQGAFATAMMAAGATGTWDRHRARPTHTLIQSYPQLIQLVAADQRHPPEGARAGVLTAQHHGRKSAPGHHFPVRSAANVLVEFAPYNPYNLTRCRCSCKCLADTGVVRGVEVGCS